MGDRLHEIDQAIDWKKFRPLVKGLYKNTGPEGGRPNIDEIIMLKLMFLGEWNTLPDPELERQCTDRISFRHFLGFPKKIPDHDTIWLFRERLVQTGKYKPIWEELQRQLDENGFQSRKVRFRMPHSLLQIRVTQRQTNPGVMRQRREGARMEFGQRKEINPMSQRLGANLFILPPPGPHHDTTPESLIHLQRCGR